MIFRIVSGNSSFQQKDCKWSTLILGNVQRTQMNNDIITKVFRINQIQPGRMGPDQPPRNNVVAMPAATNILQYSARKNKAQRIPEYSV